METPTITTILPDPREQRRRELIRRQRDFRELLAGEAWDPVMVAWRRRQLAEVAAELGMLELVGAETAAAGVAR